MQWKSKVISFFKLETPGEKPLSGKALGVTRAVTGLKGGNRLFMKE
jgi:hypothetical protein